MQRENEGVRTRWAERGFRVEERRAVRYAAARKRPLTAAARAASRLDRERPLGPYEVRYDVSHGYGVERTIIQP